MTVEWDGRHPSQASSNKEAFDRAMRELRELRAERQQSAFDKGRYLNELLGNERFLEQEYQRQQERLMRDSFGSRHDDRSGVRRSMTRWVIAGFVAAVIVSYLGDTDTDTTVNKPAVTETRSGLSEAEQQQEHIR